MLDIQRLLFWLMDLSKIAKMLNIFKCARILKFYKTIHTDSLPVKLPYCLNLLTNINDKSNCMYEKVQLKSIKAFLSLFLPISKFAFLKSAKNLFEKASTFVVVICAHHSNEPKNFIASKSTLQLSTTVKHTHEMSDVLLSSDKIQCFTNH